MADISDQELRKVCVVGASGMIGQELVDLLVSDERYHVTTFGRRAIPFRFQQPKDGPKVKEPIDHPRLSQKVIDMNALSTDAVKEQFQGFQAGFCCLGTTKSKAGSAEAFRRVDYDFIVNTARAIAEMNPETPSYFSLVSSIGANAGSFFLYPKTKGETERDVSALPFTKVSIFRPSTLLAPHRNEMRLMERISVPFMYLGGSYSKPIQVRKVARAMKIQADLYFDQLSQVKKEDEKVIDIFENGPIHAMVEKDDKENK